MEKIYLDNSATTKVDKKVAMRVKKFMIDYYGNPSSQHSLGKLAKKEIEKAREKIAKKINADKSEIIFTSGGTESNNLAIKGLALAYPEKKHIITSKIEHSSVLETCRFLETQGYHVDYVGVDKEGIIKIEEIKQKITPETLLVSIMHVNNEIGTIQPIEEVAKICKKNNVYFHTDAVQSFNKLNIDVKRMDIDLLSASGHKIHAPKGVGFIYIKNGVKIKPLLNGGGQERGIRSGTENVPGIIGLAEALSIQPNKTKIKKIRDHLIKELLKINSAKLNGSKEKRIFNNINISFYGIEGESLMMLLDNYGICVSTGSACASNKLAKSHVLQALGVDVLYLNGSIRMTIEELDKKTQKFVVNKIKESVERLQELSPFKLNSGGKNENN